MTDICEHGNRFENVILMSEYARCIKDGTIMVSLNAKEILTVVAVNAYENGEVEVEDLKKRLQKRVCDNSSKFALNKIMQMGSITEKALNKFQNKNVNFQSNSQSNNSISFATEDIDLNNGVNDLAILEDLDAEIGLEIEKKEFTTSRLEAEE